MSDKSGIQWTDATWNPVSGCTRVSAGCDHCYAVQQTYRLEKMGQEKKYGGLTVLNPRGDRHFNGQVRCHEEALGIPLKWRAGRRIFVNSMSDLFHREVPFEFIDRVMAIAALTPQHTYQLLTKRPERMAEYFLDLGGQLQWHRRVARRVEEMRVGVAKGDYDLEHARGRAYGSLTIGEARCLPNVWLGASVEDQAAADERIPHLLRCPAAVLFLSCEPLLGAVNLDKPVFLDDTRVALPLGCRCRCKELPPGVCPECGGAGRHGGVDWVIVGGESGGSKKSPPRPCDVGWVRSIVRQSKAAGVPVFVKQLGARPLFDYYAEDDTEREWALDRERQVLMPAGRDGVRWVRWEGPEIDGQPGPGTRIEVGLKDPKGGDWSEWPEDLRVREMPGVAA